MTRIYRHARLGDEVRAIGGYYCVLKEEKIPWRGRELLVVVRAARVDSSCCGAGAGSYAEVPGFVVHWRQTVDESQVEPITDESLRAEIAAALIRQERVFEVRFWDPVEKD